ncbi:hypothetical protein [Allorhodopirellula solitaria]|uniref:Uncharacterized protein n=1 Tax=Allorhodopirellula solitaria TaxID=2527987 RepID=A0A5C5XUQ1_9BACT|nr:hypothetical protein [Allorhodopirellula solitaria]TWT66458.1 hypothetical protein CA85_25530 [Allorhodopirellula solitaria]
MTPTSSDIHTLLESRIDAERRSIAKPAFVSALLFAVSLVPLIAMLSTAFFIETQYQTPWVGVILVAGTIILTFTLWQTGGHYAKLAVGHRRRVRQLEDLQLYLATVPPESWPAKQLLQIVLAGRQPSFGNIASDFCISDDTPQDDG